MAARPAASSRQLAKLVQLSPVVAAQRMLQMATTTPSTQAADAVEWTRMTQEKLQAAQEGWLGMMSALWAMQQKAWIDVMRSAWTPASLTAPLQWWQQAPAHAEQLMAAAMAPSTRRVSANARRLAKSPRR